MYHEIVGLKVGEFKLKESNEVRQYAKVYVIYDDDKDTSLNGKKAEAITIPVEIANQLNIGDCIDFVYNKYGKVKDFIKMD